MGTLVLALLAGLAFLAATSSNAVADTSLTLVRLSCNDGHSVITSVDLTTLTIWRPTFKQSTAAAPA